MASSDGGFESIDVLRGKVSQRSLEDASSAGVGEDGDIERIHEIAFLENQGRGVVRQSSEDKSAARAGHEVMTCAASTISSASP
jgi:hypothetical protein